MSLYWKDATSNGEHTMRLLVSGQPGYEPWQAGLAYRHRDGYWYASGLSRREQDRSALAPYMLAATIRQTEAFIAEFEEKVVALRAALAEVSDRGQP